MSDLVRVADSTELEPGHCKVVVAKGRQIALFNVAGTLYATDNTCIHRGGPIGEGTLEGKIVTCPWHGWTYDVTTGVCPVNPNLAVRSYAVKVEGTDVHVEV